MTNTVAGKNTPTAVSTQLDGALSVNTVPFSIEDIVVDSSANLSVGGLIQVGAADTTTETMRIISINGNTLTVYRNYPGTANESSNAHADNSKVIVYILCPNFFVFGQTTLVLWDITILMED